MADNSPISVRVDEPTRTALEMTASHLQTSVSDVLRLAADIVTHMTDTELEEAVKCPTCKGTGRRPFRTGGTS